MASIEKRATKAGTSWLVRWRDEDDKSRSKSFPRQVDAKAFKSQVEVDLQTGRYVSPAAGAVTFRSFYESWSAHQLWESGTRENFDLMVRQAPFADTPLGRIKRSHVEAWVKAMQDDDKGPQTVRTRVSNARTVLKAAVADQHLHSDPAQGVRLPRLPGRDDRMRVPSSAEVSKLLHHAPGWFAPMVALGAFAGLRIGEANGLQAGDVDFMRRTIHVRRQVQRRPPGPVEVRPPKYGSTRTVYAPDGLLQILSRHLEDVGTYGEAGWIMPGRDGGPAWPRSVDYRFGQVRDAADLPLSFHDLRHFFASGLIAAGCDVVTVQHALGHKSASVTLDVYSHLWETGEDTTRAAAQGLVDTVLGAGVYASCHQASS